MTGIGKWQVARGWRGDRAIRKDNLMNFKDLQL
jgi:hypothetical protein